MRNRKNAETHGLYGLVLREGDKKYYDYIKQFDNQTILEESYNLIHAKVMTWAKNDGDVPEWTSYVLAVFEALMEKGKIGEGTYLEARKRLLHSPSLVDIAKMLQQSTTILNTCYKLQEEARFRRENEILTQLVKDVLQRSTDANAKQIAVNCVSTLRLEAGVDVSELLEAS